MPEPATGTLYIAEKPSLGRAIAEGLGIVRRENGFFICRNGTTVTWCFGHLFEQAEPDAYLPDDIPTTKRGKKMWRLRDLPVIPTEWKTLVRKQKGVKGQLSVIGKLIRTSAVIVNAGDPDREGQLLVDEVLEHFRVRKPVKRFWVSAIDPASIKKGLAALKENQGYAGMRDAARARSRADWLLGMNLSRAYTLTGPGGLIAVGRVQTPTLAMVARRDYAVRHFVPKPYLAITANLAKDGAAFRAKWQPKPGQPGMDEEGKLLLDLPLGRSLVEKLAKEKTATVLSAETKRKRVYPPKVYSLADIQAEANRLYGFTAEETLSGCQALYEKHKVTSYPRTDSSYLPESQHAEAPGVLAAIAKTFPATAKAVEKANPTLKSPVFNDKKVTAHHGIVPVAHAVDWSQQNRTWFAAVQVEKRMMGIILFLIVLVGAFGLVSTLVMTVKEKQSDIAILRTLGASRGSIMGIFIVQGTIVGLVGVAAGVALGLLVAFNVGAIVSFIEGLFGVAFLPREIYFISSMPSDPRMSDIVPIALFSFLLSLAATLYPSWRAASIQPAEALRYE